MVCKTLFYLFWIQNLLVKFPRGAVHKWRLQDFANFLTPSPLRLHSNCDIISKYLSDPLPPYFCRRHLWMPPKWKTIKGFFWQFVFKTNPITQQSNVFILIGFSFWFQPFWYELSSLWVFLEIFLALELNYFEFKKG